MAQIRKILANLFFAFMLTSCNSTGASSQQGNVSLSYETANSYRMLTERVSIIVIGEFVVDGEQINIARDDHDSTKSSSTRYEIGQVYEFAVDTYLKGKGPLTLSIVQVEGFLSQKETRSEESIQRAKANFAFLPVKTGKKYLLFLSSLFGFPEGEYYIGPIHPWRFDISDPERVVSESPWRYATCAFPPVSLKLIIEQIQNPDVDLIPETNWKAYPAPCVNPAPVHQREPYPPPGDVP